MKILVFTSLFPNNIEPNKGVFIKERIRYLLSNHQIRVIAPVPYFPPIKAFKRWYGFSQVKQKEVIDGLEVLHPRFFTLPKFGMMFYGLFLFFSVIRAAKTLQKDFDFQLIDAHYMYPDCFSAVLLGKLFKKPVVVSARGTDINVFPKFAIIHKEIVYTLKNARKIIAVSEALKNKIIQLGIKNEKIQVIPNGVDANKFYSIPQTEARKQLRLPLDKKIILSVGNLVENKGVRYLIDAFSLLDRQGVLLIIVGDGVLRNSLEKQILRLKLEENVILTGAQPHSDLYKWYSAADVFCLASIREGWPNVLLEALVCGLPIVATKVGGIPEVLISSDFGLLVNPRDKEDLAQGIKKALNRNWDKPKLIDYACQHRWEDVAQKVTAVFETKDYYAV